MADVLVIGGGIIGLLSARALRLAGAGVCVLERGRLGGESSWAGGGIISPLYPWRYRDSVNLLAQRSKQIYPELVPALLQDSGVDAELLGSGLLIVDAGEHRVAAAWAQRYGEALEYVESDDRMQHISACLGPGFSNGLWMPDVMQVRNPLLVEALKVSCARLGVEVREHCEVNDILIEDGRARGVLAGDARIEADSVVVASGAWTGRLLAGKAAVDVQPVKGQMVMMKTAPGTVDRIIMDRGHYVIPRKDGHVLAGSTLEFSGFDKSVSGSARQQLYTRACELVPALQQAEVVRHWAGLRPGTREGVPYVCEHDEIDGLYIHAGHYRNGIVLGAASAELLAQIVSGGETSCDPTPYNLHSPH